MPNKIIYYYIPVFIDLSKVIAMGAIITAIIETIFFASLRFKNKKFLLCVFLVNIVSNIALNISLAYLPKNFYNVTSGEILVILTEFLIFYLVIKPEKNKVIILLMLTIAANIISYTLGLIMFFILGI